MKNYSNNPQSVSAASVAQSISLSISTEDEDRAKEIFNALDNCMSNVSSDADYELIKQLLKLNKRFRFRPEYDLEVFTKTPIEYRTRLWSDGVSRFISNGIVRYLWKEANDDEKKKILNRLGIQLPQPEVQVLEVSEVMGSVTPYFDHIRDEVIRNINAATRTIHVAMAWFSNYFIFKAIRSALERGVEVVLITNNDLNNNGGYCLNFNELIDKGLKLHLAEYPKMMHHKFCIIDNEVVMDGSYNWTFSAETFNQENIVVIKDYPEVIRQFEEVFASLSNQFPIFDRMPDSVPERPVVDRSAFRVYITEEMAARPHCEHIRPASNAQRTIAQIDEEVATESIRQRQEHQAELESQQQMAEHKANELAQQAAAIEQHRQEVASQAEEHAQAAANAEERQAIADEAAVQEQQLNEQLEEVHNQLNETHEVQATLAQEIVQVQTEIDVIQQSSDVETKGGRGALKVNLKWATGDDLDLHVIDPDGVDICYNNKSHVCKGITGQLDIDANAGGPKTTTPQENIFWEGQAPLGHYIVKVQWFANHVHSTSVPFTVTVYPEHGESKQSVMTLKREKEMLEVFQFDYTENGIVYC